MSEEGQGRVHRDFEQMQDVTREQFGLLVEAMSAHRIGLADDDDEDDAELEDGGLEVTDDNNNSNGDAGDAPQSGTLSCNSLARQCPQFRLRLRRIFRSKAYKLCLNLFHGLTAIFSLVEAEIINNYGDNLSDLLGMEYVCTASSFHSDDDDAYVHVMMLISASLLPHSPIDTTYTS